MMNTKQALNNRIEGLLLEGCPSMLRRIRVVCSWTPSCQFWKSQLQSNYLTITDCVITRPVSVIIFECRRISKRQKDGKTCGLYLLDVNHSLSTMVFVIVVSGIGIVDSTWGSFAALIIYATFISTLNNKLPTAYRVTNDVWIQGHEATICSLRYYHSTGHPTQIST